MLKSSAFLSLVLAFLTFVSGRGASIVLEQEVAKAPFENTIELQAGQAPSKSPVEVFTGYQCARCADFNQNTLPRIAPEGYVYVLAGESAAGLLGAQAVRCAGDQQKFTALHEKIAPGTIAMNVKSIEAEAKKAGLEPKAFHKCLTEEKYRNAVKNDTDYAKGLGALNLPAVRVKNVLLLGNPPLENIQKAIRDANL